MLPGSELRPNLTTNSATINASLNPNGVDTQDYFEYVDDADYNPSAADPYAAGAQVPAPPGTDIGSGFNVGAESVDVSGLSESTTYHFRVVAANSLGTTDGPDVTFTTFPLPTVVTTGGASQVSVTGAPYPARSIQWESRPSTTLSTG